MLEGLELSREAHEVVRERCRALGIEFLSSPFDESSADSWRISASPRSRYLPGEITNLPFLRHVSSKARPMIVSTGMSNLGEVEAAGTDHRVRPATRT